ncbi:NAD+ synthase [Cellulomonas bogoriensis]|uniref:Glutamine-dependent NAD(+) synthetase n=1 Tax=Cellulomonas bogoriensis 69B4 = DSM 16987 TaxID=1386082 RepID=A0A0A0C3R9_9CELL|nr:NAD+ synthase [Cellulomonas bogoriensis]KGM14029.1 NAD+ synthetase [Cellulomonas bogoriensis 69B4 = DSM 16987]
MAPTRLALAQIDTCVGDLDGNVEQVLDWSRRAAAAGAQVVLFPEMTLTGYPVEDLALRDSFARAADRALQTVATRLADEGLGQLSVVLGTLGRDRGGRATNRAVVVAEGQVGAVYDKHHLPTYGVFDEFRIFAPGSGPCVVEVGDRRVGVLICEDIWQEGPVAELAGQGLDLLAVLNGSPYEEGKGHVRTELAARRAAEVGAPVAYVNMVGGQDDLVFDGGSFVVGPDGQLLTSAPQFVEHLLVWDLPPAGGAQERGELAPAMSADAEVYAAAVTGLRGYARKNGFSSVVLGFSGGIDSALVAAIAADALGGENVVGVSMPSQHSSDHSRDDAADLARRIGADYRVQPIAGIVASFDGMRLTGLAAENLQARVRGVILMALSNMEGHLVLATGNKSELAVGYSTIYGDAVGGYAPIKDVDKSRVWALARWRNQTALDAGEVPPIPEASITKPPSAELSPGQVDTDSLPPYHLLDEVLDAYIEHAEGREELLARGFEPAVVDKVLALVDGAEWKRRQYPPGPKVTALAFGRDRRLPVTSRWREPKGPVDV